MVVANAADPLDLLGPPKGCTESTVQRMKVEYQCPLRASVRPTECRLAREVARSGHIDLHTTSKNGYVVHHITVPCRCRRGGVCKRCREYLGARAWDLCSLCHLGEASG